MSDRIPNDEPVKPAPSPWITGAEGQVAAWNATQRGYPRDANVAQLVEAQAAATPNAVALTAGAELLTYAQLDTRANQLAHYLRSLGVGPDVVVAICLERCLSLVVGALAILKAGGAYLPLDPSYPPCSLAGTLIDAQPHVLLTQQSMAERLPAGGWRVVALDVDGPLIARHPAESPTSKAMSEHLAYVIYTSGSTGQPKGVQITHDSLLNLVFWHQRTFKVTSADRATQQAAPGFDAAVWELWPYLAAGASVHLADESTRNTPESLRDWLVAQGITISFVPTALCERLIALPWPAQTALRVLLTGADTLHHYPPHNLPFILVNNYGPTECTVVATSGQVLSGERLDRRPTIGRPITNTQIYILNEQLKQVPVGTMGELYIGGVGLARGYLNRPDLTAQKFLPNPFNSEPGARLYRTGDLARFLSDGQIEFLGRIDEQVKIRGYRIEPREIVTVLDAHPRVQASLVVAREDTPGDKRLVAYIVPVAESYLTDTDLRDFLRTRLPEYMLPAVFVALSSLPLTPSGKVDRAALPAPHDANILRDEVFVPPCTPVEERLAAIVAPLLHLERIGVNDNFFLLGGHSLLGTQLVSRVRETFGVELTLLSLFDNPTIKGMSGLIERLLIARVEGMSGDEVWRFLAPSQCKKET